MSYNRPTSFSQTEMFFTCPKSWHMKYVQDIPRIEDLKYAHRGNVVHHCLEKYYPDKTMEIEEVKKLFEEEWNKVKLDETSLKNKKDETWLMILNGINLDLDVTSTELKIWYPDVVGYIDIINTKTGKISDWKSSTRSNYNEKTYMMQLKYYSWLFYRKFGELPTETDVKYLKYTGTKGVLSHVPTIEDVKAAEKWHNEGRRRMSYYVKHPEKLPPFNKDYFFCPYKHLWDVENLDPKTLMAFVIEVSGNFFYIKGPVDKFLDNHLDNKYSYELKTAEYIKKYKPDANTTVKLYSKKLKRLPIGFLRETMKTLHDYAMIRKKTPVITLNDKRCFNPKILDMPENLLSGKELRPYQTEAVEMFVNRNKIAMLEISTGSGKTLIGTEIVRRLRSVTIFVVDKKELLYQTKQTFEDNLGIKVGILGDGKKDIQDVTVATIQTVMKMLDNVGPIIRLRKSIKNDRWIKHKQTLNFKIPFEDMHPEDMTLEQHDEQSKAYDKLNRMEKEYIKNYMFTKDELIEIATKQKEVNDAVQKMKYYLGSVRFSVFDEAHKVASNSYYKLGIYLKNTEYRLGLCLNPSTRIFDENGHIKKIKDIKQGEKVLSYNHTTKQIEPKKVLNIFRKNIDEKYEITIKTKIGKRKIVCSKKHKFFINGKYISAEQLSIGNKLFILERPDKHLDNVSKHKEVRKKISKKLKGHIKSKEECKKISEGLKGNIPWNKNKKGLQKSHRKGINIEDEYSAEKALQIKTKKSKN